MRQGDIHWVELPPPMGREQAGCRPAVIMQAYEFTARLPTILVVPLTGQLTTLRFPATGLIQPDAQNGLSVLSVCFGVPNAGRGQASGQRAVWVALPLKSLPNYCGNWINF